MEVLDSDIVAVQIRRRVCARDAIGRCAIAICKKEESMNYSVWSRAKQYLLGLQSVGGARGGELDERVCTEWGRQQS